GLVQTLVAIDGSHAGESELGHQPVQLPLHTAEPPVGSHLRHHTLCQARLFCVEFPWMEIDARRLTLVLVDPPDAGSRVTIRQQPQIRAAPDWDDYFFGHLGG